MFNLLRSLYFILGWKIFGAQHCGGGMRFNIVYGDKTEKSI